MDVRRIRAGQGWARWNVWAAAALLVVAVPLGMLCHHLGQAFLDLWNRLIQQSAGSIPPGTVPGSDEALMVAVFAVVVTTLSWAHGSLQQGIRRRAVPFLGLLAVWAVVCFSDGISAGFAAITVGMFGLVVLCDLALLSGGGGGSPDEPFIEAADGLCDPRLERRRR